MSDAMINGAIQKVTEHSTGGEGPPAQQTADASDVSRFENAMESTDASEATEVVDEPQTSAFDQVAETPPSTEAPTLGDAILNGIEKMKVDHDQAVDRINDQLEATDGEPMSIEDTMKLQFELMQLNMQQDLTTKVADKTSQGVQQLFRNQ